LGGEKTKELYNCERIVPIKIGKNLIETAYNCMSVRIHSTVKQQNAMIGKKLNRRESLKQLTNPISLEAFKKAKRIEKKFGADYEEFDDIEVARKWMRVRSWIKKSEGTYKSTKLFAIKTKKNFY